MPFHLTFDSNQEASARKYFSRNAPVQPLNPPVTGDSCPQVKPPKCPSGQRLNVTYGEPPCRTPNYTCRPLTAQDYEMCKTRKFSCSENPDDYCCQPNPFADPLEFCRYSPDQARCSDYWLRNKCVTSYTTGQGIPSVQCPPKPSVEPLACPTPMPPACAPNQIRQQQGVITMANGCKIPNYACVPRISPIFDMTAGGGLTIGSGGGLAYLPVREYTR